MKQMIQVTCEGCGKVYTKQLSRHTYSIKMGKKQFCSVTCSHIYATELARITNTIPFSAHINISKKNAKTKGLEFDLTPEILKEMYEKQDGNCALTGIKMEMKKNSDTKNLFHVSVDRIDNSKGYTKDNIQLVLLGINYMRNTSSIEEVTHFLQVLRE